MNARQAIWAVAAGLSLVSALLVHTVSAQAPSPEPATDLQAPEHRSTRLSAYSLPAGMWGFDVAMLGSSQDELFGRLGVARGFRHGIQIDCNFLYWTTAILQANVRWTFVERPRFAIAVELGVLYAHGAWVWVLGDVAQDVVSDSDLVSIPVSAIASVPLNRWLQFDLTVQYRHGELYGALLEGGRSLEVETQLGVRQLVFRPTARFYLTSRTALEFGTRLPAFTRIPVSADATLDTPNNSFSKQRSDYEDVAFSDGWGLEFGVRSRLKSWLYATLRLQYGQVAKQVYGSAVFPSFGMEFRL